MAASPLTFTAGGAATQNAIVATIADTGTESDETILVTLASASGAVIAGGTATGVITGDAVPAAPAQLPVMGANAAPVAIAASILTLLGAVTLVLARRRAIGTL